MIAYLFVAVTVFLLAAAPGDAIAQSHDGAGHALGTVRFPISCSKAARVEFERGVALLHHMTYPRAREAFQLAAKTDPRCAMAYWGVAMTLFQPLWPTRPGPDELRRGWEAVQTASRLAPPTERERGFVAAAAAFFQNPESGDYWQRIRRWEQAMERAYRAFPEDPEVAAFYALAHLAVTPSDTISSANSERAARLLLAVYRQNPDHPGAMHYLVHASDVAGRERESLEIVRKYQAAAPRNPHALHMPTHISIRLGDWEAVIRGNLLAAAAALEQPAGDRGQYVWDEFPHAIEYLVYGYLQRGADGEAQAQLERLEGTDSLQPSFKTAFHLASTRVRYALERHAWSEAMALVPRDPPTLDWDRFTWPEAVTWFARGMGAARERRVGEARTAARRLDVLEMAAGKAGEDLFTRNIRILRLAVSAWVAHLEEDSASSVARMREASDLEMATPKHAVTPGPTIPAHELLGDLLLEQKRPAEALEAYQKSLQLYPRRLNSLLGATRAARALGDESKARAFHRELLQVTGGAIPRAGP